MADVTAPTLVVAGGPRSHIPQDQPARAAARVPDAALTMLDAGHMVHDEQPAGSLALLRDFLGAAGPDTRRA